MKRSTREKVQWVRISQHGLIECDMCHMKAVIHSGSTIADYVGQIDGFILAHEDYVHAQRENPNVQPRHESSASSSSSSSEAS